MKHLSSIVLEFDELKKIARKWDDLLYDEQKGYLGRHPLSRRKITAKPEGQEKSRKKPKSLKRRLKEQKRQLQQQKQQYGPGQQLDDRDRKINESRKWRKNKFDELKKTLPNNQKEWAAYLINTDREGESYANQIKEMYKNKPIILDMHGGEEQFLVPSIVPRYNQSYGRWAPDEFGEPQYKKMLSFKSVEDAKSFIDDEPELAKKVELRSEIEKVTKDIQKNYEATVAPESTMDDMSHYFSHMYIAENLARIPREDTYGTRINVDKTESKYLVAKGQSFNLSVDDHKKIGDVINHPAGSTIDDVKFAIDNLDKFTNDVMKYKKLEEQDKYNMKTAQDFLDKKDKIKKGLQDSISKLELKDRLIKQHGFETKDNITLPEGFEFRDKPKLSYEAYNDIILGNDNIEIHLSLGKPGSYKYGGEVYYKVPGKDGAYMLGRPGFDSGIYGDWDDNQDVNQLIQEKINKVKAKQDRISQMTVQIPVKGSRQGGGIWSVTPERFEEMKNELKSGKRLTFSPSGMGIGYNVSTRPSRFSDKASKELDDMFGMPLYIESYDHD